LSNYLYIFLHQVAFVNAVFFQVCCCISIRSIFSEK